MSDHKKEEDNVINPNHYKSHPSGIECIDVVEHMSFCLGNAIKYIWRAGQKDDIFKDLRKAIWYINQEIDRLKRLGYHEEGDPKISLKEARAKRDKEEKRKVEDERDRLEELVQDYKRSSCYYDIIKKMVQKHQKSIFSSGDPTAQAPSKLVTAPFNDSSDWSFDTIWGKVK